MIESGPQSDYPIACRLDEREFALRSDDIRRSLFAAVEQIDELPDGYAYRFPSDDQWIVTIAQFIAAERHCCPFFTFDLEVRPDHGPIWLRLRGSDTVKAFIRDQLQGALPLSVDPTVTTPEGVPAG